MNDIFREYCQISYSPFKFYGFIIISLEDLYTNDEILSDEHFHKYSLDKTQQHSEDNPTGFRLYSDYFTIKYPHCILDRQSGALSPKNDAPVVNFNQLKELLLSKDLSRIGELEWIASEPARFLDNSIDMTGNKVALTSYPRSGNSFLRKLLEDVTGITTGGEQKRDLQLQCAGLMGEGHSADN